MITISPEVDRFAASLVTDLSKQTNYLFPGTLGSIKAMADPLLTGYSFMFFTRIPQKVKDTIGSHADTFFKVLERAVKEVSGFNDVELESVSIQHGFTQNEHKYVTGVNKGHTEITTKYQEWCGNFISAPFTKWVSSIRDPETGLYTFGNSGNMNMTEYSVDFIYIQCNPSVGAGEVDSTNPNNIGRGHSVEFAAYFTGCVPKKIPLSHRNFTSGSHDTVEIDMPWICNMHVGSQIDKYALDIVMNPLFRNIIKEAENNILDTILSSSSTNPLDTEDLSAITKLAANVSSANIARRN